MKKSILEYHSDAENSHKFWQITEIGNNQVEVRWGRIGSVGQAQIISKVEAEKRYSEKLNKGYELVDSDIFIKAMSESTAAAAKSKASAKEPKKKTKEDDIWTILINSAK